MHRELLGVCCTGQDHLQQNRSHTGDFGRDAACPTGWIGTAAPTSEARSPGSSLAEGSGACHLGCRIAWGQMCPEAVPAGWGAGDRVCPAPRMGTGTKVLGHCLQTSCCCR